MTKQEILLAQKEFLFPAVFNYFNEPLVVSHAKDQYVWDADGNQYLDFFGGIVTVSVGHCNSRVNEKVHAQIDTLEHVSTVFAERAAGGAGAKAGGHYARRRSAEIVFHQQRHGGERDRYSRRALLHRLDRNHRAAAFLSRARRRAAMTLTGQSPWRLGPPQAGVVHAVNAYCYRCPFGLEYPSCEVKCAQDIEQVIRTSTSGRVAALIAEPIQGVGGFITPPKEYFKIVTDIVRKVRRHLHCRRSADGVGTHRKEMVRHRALGRAAGHYYQREGPG